MNKENIPVITDREKLYDKCENMEQLFDNYYLPLLDKHYSKTYELQQENQKYKEVIDKLKEDLNLIIEYGDGEDASRYDKQYGEFAKNHLKYMDEVLKEVK